MSLSHDVYNRPAFKQQFHPRKLAAEADEIRTWFCAGCGNMKAPDDGIFCRGCDQYWDDVARGLFCYG